MPEYLRNFESTVKHILRYPPKIFARPLAECPLAFFSAILSDPERYCQAVWQKYTIYLRNDVSNVRLTLHYATLCNQNIYDLAVFLQTIKAKRKKTIKIHLQNYLTQAKIFANPQKIIPERVINSFVSTELNLIKFLNQDLETVDQKIKAIKENFFQNQKILRN